VDLEDHAYLEVEASYLEVEHPSLEEPYLVVPYLEVEASYLEYHGVAFLVELLGYLFLFHTLVGQLEQQLRIKIKVSPRVNQIAILKRYSKQIDWLSSIILRS
jgi:hypothetical protein